MSDAPDKESKTLEPTEKRIQDAVQKGNIPFSREAAGFTSILVMLIAAKFLLVDNGARLTGVLQHLIEGSDGLRIGNSADAFTLLATVGYEMAVFLAPVLALFALGGVLASVLQSTPQLVLTRIAPDLSRVSIMKGWTRIFGSHGQFEFLKALFKLVVVSLIAYVALSAAKVRILNAVFMDPLAVPSLVQTLSVNVLVSLCIAMLVLVGADIVWSRFSWLRDLRMTHQEMKDEMKQVDGDPAVKARQRAIARDRARKRMMAAVPKATVIIANPTHYAVALRYVREETAAPMVVAKGQDLIALRIRHIAEENGIPVIEDKLLARALYNAVEVDRMIPPEFYKAVAGIVYYLMSRSPRPAPLH